MIQGAKRTVIGLIEPVRVIGDRDSRRMNARIDSGATRSSIDRALVQKLGLRKTPLTRRVRSSHGTTTRQIVKGKIKLAGKELPIEFTVADRAHMTYSLLIGQDVLKRGRYLIDPCKR